MLWILLCQAGLVHYPDGSLHVVTGSVGGISAGDLASSRCPRDPETSSRGENTFSFRENRLINPINAPGVAPGPNHHQKDRLASAAVLLTIVDGTNPIQVPKKAEKPFSLSIRQLTGPMPSGRKSLKPCVPPKGAAGNTNPIIRPGLMPGPSGTKTPGADAAVSNLADDAPVGSSRAVAASSHTNPASESEGPSSAVAAAINPADDAPVGSSRAVVAPSSNAGPAPGW